MLPHPRKSTTLIFLSLLFGILFFYSFKEFLAFLSVFPLLSQILGVRLGRKILALSGDFLAFYRNKQGTEDQGKCCDRLARIEGPIPKRIKYAKNSSKVGFWEYVKSSPKADQMWLLPKEKATFELLFSYFVMYPQKPTFELLLAYLNYLGNGAL